MESGTPFLQRSLPFWISLACRPIYSPGDSVDRHHDAADAAAWARFYIWRSSFTGFYKWYEQLVASTA